MSQVGLSGLYISGGERLSNIKKNSHQKLLDTFIIFKLIVPLFSNNLGSHFDLWLEVLGLLSQKDVY